MLTWDGMEIVPDDPTLVDSKSRQPSVGGDMPTTSSPKSRVLDSIPDAPSARKSELALSAGRSTASNYAWLDRASSGVGDIKPDHSGRGVEGKLSGSTASPKQPPANGLSCLSARSSRDHEAAKFSDLLPTKKRDRVALALDRMGGAVVEVRDAYQRWVSQDIIDGINEPNNTDEAERAATSAMAQLRLPMKLAGAASKGIGAPTIRTLSFSEFVGCYAEAAGLLKHVPDSTESWVWVEGPNGTWIALSTGRLRGARAIFDEATEECQETASDTESEGELDCL